VRISTAGHKASELMGNLHLYGFLVVAVMRFGRSNLLIGQSSSPWMVVSSAGMLLASVDVIQALACDVGTIWKFAHKVPPL
jgi:hypothetical protein